MTAPPTPKAFLARVRESASTAAEAVAEFLTAVKQGCRLIEDMEMFVGTDVSLENVFVEEWPGAVRPECEHALESCMQLVSEFVSPPQGGTLDITAPYTPSDDLTQHAMMLRGIHRTAVNLCNTLRDIPDRLKANVEPWIFAHETDKLSTLTDTLRSYGVNADATDHDTVDHSIEPELPAVADRPNDSVRRVRLRLDRSTREAELDGEIFQLTSEGTLLVAGLIEANNDWITSAKLLEPHNIKTRAGRIMSDIPGPIENCIESKPGKGYKLVVTAAVS